MLTRKRQRLQIEVSRSPIVDKDNAVPIGSSQGTAHDRGHSLGREHASGEPQQPSDSLSAHRASEEEALAESAVQLL